VLDLFTVGSDTIAGMENQSIICYSYKRNSKVKTLATKNLQNLQKR